MVAIFIAVTGSVFINENVIFQKTNDITVTHAKWLASFVIDLKPFNMFLDKLSEDISTAMLTSNTVLHKFKGKNMTEFSTTLLALQKEVAYLNETRNFICEGIKEYRLLPRRERRSLIPIIGEALSWAFGLISEKDLTNIRKNINNLAENQQRIMHVVHESISILNMSRIEISENRHAIMGLVTSVLRLDKKLENLVNELQRQISENKHFTEMYLKLDLIIGEIKDMVQNAMFYLEHLQTQLNFLALGKLNPSCLSPKNLLHLLTEIKSHLPSSLSLISDPKTNLWLYYKQLQTSALLFDDKIVVVIKIPLLQVNNQYEIWKVFNLPIIIRSLDGDQNAQGMVATYRIESSGLMINKAKTKYALLNQVELAVCSEPTVNYCNVQSPIFPVNLAKLCIVHLFLQKTEMVRKYCESIVMMNTRLPFAIKLMNFLWGVVSQTELTFSIVCNNDQSITKITKPPIDILRVGAECIASNDFFTLTSSYVHTSDFEVVNEDLNLLRSINISQINVLSPLEIKYPNFSKITLPDSLNSIEQISMKNLISELDNFQPIVKETEKWPKWVYFCIGVTVISLVTCCICIYRKYGSKIKEACCCLFKNCQLESTVLTKPDQGTQPGVSTDVEGQTSVPDGQEPTAPTGRSIYPALFPGACHQSENTRL